MMEQHAKKPFPSMRQSGARIPESLERVVARATAKRPSDRYASVSEMIEDLENFLGVRSGGRFSPTKPQADLWDSIVTDYGSAAAGLRFARPLVATWAAICVLLTFVVPMLSLTWWLLGPSMLTAALATASLLAAHRGKSATLSKLAPGSNQWHGAIGRSDWPAS